MKTLFFCPRWGSADLPIDAFMEKVKTAGYDGVEIGLPPNDPALARQTLEAIARQDLGFIAQHAGIADPDPEKHLDEYRRRLEIVVQAKPLLVNAHTGRDWFTFAQNQAILTAARTISEQSGVKVLHETHRARFSFSAAATAAYLQADPALRISADFSHWCVVSESLLADQADAVALAISRADHIHTRIGHPEGAQVSDPRAPEWEAALQAHLGWWDRIVDSHRQRGTAMLTMTTEFGPPPYLPTLPYTRMPVASQWDINVHMMALLRERYGAA